MGQIEVRRERRKTMQGCWERLSLAHARHRPVVAAGIPQVEMRAKPNGTGGTDYVYTGYATVYGAEFDMWDPWGEPYTEYVLPGAARRSLGNKDLDVRFLIGHDDADICLASTKGRTLKLADDLHGVHVEARMDGSLERVRRLASAVGRGDQDEMSLAFVCNEQHWDEGYEKRGIVQMELQRGDISSVVYGANPATAGSSMVPMELLAAPRPVVIGGPWMREYRAASLAVQHGHPGKPCVDPDGDGDCDATPQGDTDHDYWTADGKQVKPLPEGRSSDGRPYELRADMSTADINDLPDSAFAYISPGGSKDGEGKTTPRDLRHLPVHDEAHTRNALSRLPQTDIPDSAKAAALAKIKAAARKFGIDVADEHAAALWRYELRASAAEDMNLASSSDYDAAAADHPYDGTHSHEHSDYAGGTHTHDHDHAQDANHGHHGTDATVTVDASTGIPGEESQMSAARKLEQMMRELELEELASAR